MRKKDKNLVNESVIEVAAEATAPKKKKKRKKAPIVIAIIVILFLLTRVASCALMPEATVVVTTVTASRGDLQDSISTSGTVYSEEKRVVFAPVSGSLDQVNVAAGDAVRTGDVLITYNMEDMDDSLKQAELQHTKSEASYQSAMADNTESQAKLNEANVNLGVLEQQLKDHKAWLKELQENLDENIRGTNHSLADESYTLSSESANLEAQMSALDKADPEYATKLAQLQEKMQSVSSQRSRNQYLQQVSGSSDYVVEMEEKIAEVQETIAELEEYKAEMEAQKTSSENTILDTYDKQQYSADRELANMSYQSVEKDYHSAQQGIVATFDGIVTECTAVQGAMVAEGTQLLTLESSSDVKVSFNASKQDVEKLKIGQKVEITVTGKTYEGEVSKINRMAAVTNSGTPMVGVEVHITNPDEQIILGMDAKLIVYTDKTENALLIPVEVINADKEGDFLYVVENGVVVRKPIVCGISTDVYTEVLEGITEEEQIIATSFGDLEEGIAVTVMPEQNMMGTDATNAGMSVTITAE